MSNQQQSTDNSKSASVAQVQEMEAAMVNPHVPEYMTKRLYLGEDSGATLEHQKGKVRIR